MHIKYRRIELCKGFIFWVAVSLKLLGELQCVKQEISPLKKSSSSENFCQALDNCGRLKIRLLLYCRSSPCVLHLRPKSHLNDALNL